MVNVPSIDEVTRKWKSRASGAASDYSAGIARAPGAVSAALAAKGSWASGVQAAVSNDSFAKGLGRSSDAAWKTAAATKGAARYGPGIAAAEGEFRTGMGRVLSAISGVTLPPRGPKGVDNNIERVRAMAKALEALKQ